MIGKSIAHYTITEKIGEGGMGEVYRATDTKLKRDVALKVLPESFTQDPQRVARFRREAEVLASLNHSNIGAIYGLEESAESQVLVLELIEGETLGERISRGAIPLEEPTQIAFQIAEALEAAHDKGIIHRDLKPANIKITPEGHVKVLDFGLAKAVEAPPTSDRDVSQSPTQTMQATQAGVILGTAGYMSPEQARGQSVDARSDIWGFGAILFEMLSAKRPFEGEDITLTLAAVVKEEPDWNLLPEAARPLRWIIARCLSKEPRQRFHHITDVRIAAEESLAREREQDDDKAGGTRVTSIARVMLPIATALLAAAVTWVGTRPAAVVQPRMEFSVPLPADVSARRVSGAGVAVSPDGRFLVVVVDPLDSQDSMLSIRRLDSVGTAPLEGTEGAFAPFFSPDSQWIGFFTDEHLMRIPVAGGRASPITEKGPYSRATWSQNDTIVLGWSLAFGKGPLATVSATGGEAIPLTTLQSDEQLHHLPHGLPDGRHVLFSAHSQDGGDISVASLDSGTHRRLDLSGSDVRYVAPDRIMFSRDDSLFEAPFDLELLEVTGPEVGILADAHVLTSGLGISIGLLDIDSAGNLFYLAGLASRSRHLMWFDAVGQESRTNLESDFYRNPRMSPDGRRFVVGVGRIGDGTLVGRNHIRVVDVARGLPLDLDTGGLDPTWGPNDTITFAEGWPLSRLSQVPADNSSPPELLLELPDSYIAPQDWSPDGSRLVFSSRAKKASRGSVNHFLSLLVPGTDPKSLLDSPADEVNGRISPDGNWLAYQSTASGQTRIYVRPFDRPGGTQTVSGEGGRNPVWQRDGSALFFLEQGKLMKAPIDYSPFTIGAATALFNLPLSTGSFDVGPDGRFLVVLGSTSGEGDQLRVVLGWRF